LWWLLLLTETHKTILEDLSSTIKTAYSPRIQTNLALYLCLSFLE
jgi:hypothetical protein